MSRKKKIIITIIALITLLALYFLVPSPITRIFISSQTLNEAVTRKDGSSGIPNDVVTDAHAIVNIRWTKGSVSDGNDYCSVFDKDTRQVYFTKSISGGNTPSGPVVHAPVRTFYINGKISVIEASILAENNCFK